MCFQTHSLSLRGVEKNTYKYDFILESFHPCKGQEILHNYSYLVLLITYPKCRIIDNVYRKAIDNVYLEEMVFLQLENV